MTNVKQHLYPITLSKVIRDNHEDEENYNDLLTNQPADKE